MTKLRTDGSPQATNRIEGLYMRVFESPQELQQYITEEKRKGKTVGFVPTMGFLHEGHLSLLRAVRPDVDILVMSIFVNPLQFAPSEDLKTYPRDIAKDQAMVEKEGVDILFLPSDESMYPSGYSTYVGEIELSQRWCGKSRPGHFRGVTTVVLKLFNIVQPDISVFGEKDYQQAKVIAKMASDLNLPVTIRTCPIVREPDGLAMSSRNSYLTSEQRQAALALTNSLDYAINEFRKGVRQGNYLIQAMCLYIQTQDNIKLDYVACVDKDTLSPKEHVDVGDRLLVAAYVGETRLIDNKPLTLE